MNYKKEVQEVLTQIRFIKNRLAGITLNMDEEGRDPASLEEALEALDDAVDTGEPGRGAGSIGRCGRYFGRFRSRGMKR